MTLNRRRFVRNTTMMAVAASAPLSFLINTTAAASPATTFGKLPPATSNEDLFTYIHRVNGGFNLEIYRQLLGCGNPFKEGDFALGIAAVDEESRMTARKLLAHTRVADLDAHPVFVDQLTQFITKSSENDKNPTVQNFTLGELKQFLLDQSEKRIKTIIPGLSSLAIGCVVKLMSNEELIRVGAKVFHRLGDSQIGEQGYMGARIQPNSPTDNLDDIRWQVFNGWAYAVGDVLLGTNPVSSTPESVESVELALKDILETFGLQDVMPHCVLSHIDVQSEVEALNPTSTALWFQSIAGTDGANQTFDISVDKMTDYASKRTGRFDLYFETGQGADFTNGHGNGFDMVLHESRKYGFARALKQQVATAKLGTELKPWVHVNDVAGFIGPEVFRTREQLVRCCLEDIVMGKLHGLTIGLDVCSTLHMEVSLDDLDWCLDAVMPANPAYLMALPTKIDPMLGYLTTGFQDHVRLRNKFQTKVNDEVWKFFKNIGIIDKNGLPTSHFGDPVWVYQQYCQRKGDSRSAEDIRRDGNEKIAEVRARGVFITQGFGQSHDSLAPEIATEVRRIYDDAKQCIWAELTPAFITSIPNAIILSTKSSDRNDYILHPTTGERLSAESVARLLELRAKRSPAIDVQILISDGLNALSIMERGHMAPFLSSLRHYLESEHYHPAEENLVIRSGRVRAGYQIGELLYRGLPKNRTILHLIGERPGTGHRTFSVYITAPQGDVWTQLGKVDHNITKLVSGIATTALVPDKGAEEVVRILRQMTS